MSDRTEKEKQRVVAELNDEFRKSFSGGTVYITSGVQGLGSEVIDQTFAAVKAFDAFTLDNDPYHAHDFDCLTIDRHTPFWKIDYYDRSLKFASEDPTDTKTTKRVPTVLLAEEY